jgi:hypothetical protein
LPLRARDASYAEYAEFGDRLRRLGFAEDIREGAPVCRWIQQGTTLDVMPLIEKILGFSNRWYRSAMDSAVSKGLADDLEIRMVTAPFFVATKLEAFKGRGKRDFFGSHDLEDVISVVDGRAEIVTEVQSEAGRTAFRLARGDSFAAGDARGSKSAPDPEGTPSGSAFGEMPANHAVRDLALQQLGNLPQQ